MNEEEKKAAAEAAKKEEADFEASIANLSDEEKEAKRAEKKASSSQNNNADIEAELKRERERALRAEADLEETRKKAREAAEERRKKREAAGLAPEEGDDDKPLTRREQIELLEQERVKMRKEAQETRVRETARQLSESDVEAELVVEIWKNRTLPGTVEEQIEEAHAIATSRRLKAQNSEYQRALAGKEGVATDGLHAQRKQSPFVKREPEVSETDKTVYGAMKWDEARKAYSKIIAGGRKILFTRPAKGNDPRKVWTEDAPKQK